MNTAGINWIRQERRLAIYLRDGLSCAYCGDSLEEGAQLSLEHLIPRSQGGSNQVTNLVTACHRCNSARGDRPFAKFSNAAAGYLDHGITAAQIQAHVQDCTGRDLPLDEAKALIARRGSATRALTQLR